MKWDTYDIYISISVSNVLVGQSYSYSLPVFCFWTAEALLSGCEEELWPSLFGSLQKVSSFLLCSYKMNT